MQSVSVSSATSAPPIVFQVDRVRRRVAASDSVALLLSEMAFGPTRRADLGALASVTASRVAAAGAGARS